jgi:hypothetical protein
MAGLSIPTFGFAMSEDEREALINANYESAGDAIADPAAMARGLESLKSRLQPLFANLPEGAFVRLGSRSPKDSWAGFQLGFKVKSAEDAVFVLTGSSERMMEDLTRDRLAGVPTHVFLRAWRDIPAWAEFRCFMKARRLVATGQYDCMEQVSHPEIAARENTIQSAILAFFLTKFRDAAPLDDLVFDVFMVPNDKGTLDVVLLEINPFNPVLTYPGAFNWSEVLTHDGPALFRYL